MDASTPRTRTWDARYAASPDAVPAPAEVLRRHAGLLPEVGPSVAPDGDAGGDATGPAPAALDLACGRAGNGEWLGARGFRVSAWDASARVIAAIRARPASRIDCSEVRDVLVAPPLACTFDVIVVTRFLERAACPAIAAALRPGGLLFYQTFTHGLANPDYLLGPNELLALFPDLDVLRYREPGPGVDGRAEADCAGAGRTEAMLVARRAYRVPVARVVEARYGRDAPSPDLFMSRIDNFEAMLARGPDSEMLRFSLGNAYLADEQPLEATTHLRRAVELKPDYSAAWKQLGRALAASDEPVAALAAFERGRSAAEANGDKQTVREIEVFSRRVQRLLDAGHGNDPA